jgi:hypothetical protein
MENPSRLKGSLARSGSRADRWWWQLRSSLPTRKPPHLPLPDSGRGDIDSLRPGSAGRCATIAVPMDDCLSNQPRSMLCHQRVLWLVEPRAGSVAVPIRPEQRYDFRPRQDWPHCAMHPEHSSLCSCRFPRQRPFRPRAVPHYARSQQTRK